MRLQPHLGLSRPWPHGDLGLLQTFLGPFTHTQHGEGVGAKGQEALEQPLEGLPGRQGTGRHRDASGRQSSGSRGGDRACPGGRGQSPAWHLPLQDSEWGEHRGQLRPRSRAPRPAKGRGDGRTRTPRHCPRAQPQGRCSPSEPCDVAAASSPEGTGGQAGRTQ